MKKPVYHADDQGEKKDASGYGKNLHARRQGLDVGEHEESLRRWKERDVVAKNNVKTCHTQDKKARISLLVKKTRPPIR
ncbi:TPA: hypothetical protein DEP34_05265 [Candidatus Uhrbacteria bacterium]|nr:hypothetical protein [Candidatus Uhrbacteria bacterium]HCB19748.1 hypothetical protein [Candidatus Uhrbacteria bacterium]